MASDPVVTKLRAAPSMPLAEFMRLFVVDEDLGLRFERVVDGVRSRLTLQMGQMYAEIEADGPIPLTFRSSPVDCIDITIEVFDVE